MIFRKNKSAAISAGGTILSNFSASIVVFLVALPLCLGIAMASGAPLLAGIITGVTGGLVVAAISGSALSVSGPAAGLTVIVLGAITTLGSYQAFTLAVVLAGILQVAMGWLKAGSVSNFFPGSVIEGMLASIGLVLIINQLPVALGEGKGFFKETYESFEANQLHLTIGGINPLVVLITMASVAILLLWPRFKALSLIPAPLVVVVTGITANLLSAGTPWELTTHQLVNVPAIKTVSGFFDLFTMPDFSRIADYKVWKVGFTIAIVASIETLLSLEAVDKIDPLKRNSPPNRELVAQGIGNVVAGMLGGLPLTSVIVRSSANVNAGANGKTSAIMHGVWLMASFIILPGVLNTIPLACLAAILLVTGYKLARVSLFAHMYRKGWSQFLPFAVTIAAVLATDLLKGVGIGMAVAVLNLLRINMRIPYFYKQTNDGDARHVRIHLAEEVSFLNKAAIRSLLAAVKPGTHVVIDGTNSMYIDPDILEEIKGFAAAAQARKISVSLQNLQSSYGVLRPDTGLTKGASFNYRKLKRLAYSVNS